MQKTNTEHTPTMVIRSVGSKFSYRARTIKKWLIKREKKEGREIGERGRSERGEGDGEGRGKYIY